MNRTAVSSDIAAKIERAETEAWLDMYKTIPPDYMQQFKPEILEVDGVVLTRCAAIPFVHFNHVLDLGIGKGATETQLDEIIGCYGEAGIGSFTILHNEHCRPPELVGWMEQRGFRARGMWDRIYRPSAPLTAPMPTAAGSVEFVDEETADEWANYLVTIYGLPTGPWLRAFAARDGWTHAILRNNGAIVAVRSMFTHDGTWAWMGVEAPVPGLMGPTYAEDYALDYALVEKGLAMGIESFTADIEAPSAAFDTPAYENWSALGFTTPYGRTMYVHD